MNTDKVDWSQLWYPGPTRVFTPVELARAGADRPSRTLVTITMLNLAIAAMVLLQVAPPRATALLTGLLAAAALAGFKLGQALWREPTRRGLNQYCVGIGLVAGLGAALIRVRVADEVAGTWAFYTCAGLGAALALGLWFLTLYRAQQIAARLREEDERAHREDLARQLTQAQIQPHFLFNSLASLQHWVQTRDDRAVPLLDALMGFLRATLPLFDRTTLRIGDEAQAVRHYLGVMQLRLGERLRWSVEVEERAADALLPPGLLLTLVENAIEHGVQKSLSGAEVTFVARSTNKHLRVEVGDSGPGVAPGAVDGVGLANARARLAQNFGSAASLTLAPAPGGGTIACIDCPLTTSDP